MSETNNKFARAKDFAANNNFGPAIKLLNDIIKEKPDFIDAYGLLGQIYLAQNHTDKAIDCFNHICGKIANNPWAHFDLGQAFEQAGKYKQACKSYLRAFELAPDNARFLLFAGACFWEAGEKQQALELFSIGADMDPAVRIAYKNPKADKPSREKSLLADQTLREHFSALHRNSLETANNPPRLASSLWVQTHNGPVNFVHKDLRPWVFYAPDLPPRPVFRHPDDEWCKQLEAASNDIRDEYLAYMESNGEKSPYVNSGTMLGEEFSHLKGQDNWTAVHLYQNGIAQKSIKHFPKTLKALQNAPLVHFFGKPMEVFFSVLKPGVHIPPHFGTANTRLTTHLPLIIPSSKCRIRVADYVHHWQEGKIFWFDDSWDHEAFNDSDGVRVVLIFESWRPDMSKAEIRAVMQSFEDRASWLENRKIPKL